METLKEKIERWTASVKCPKSKVEMRRVATEMGIKPLSSNFETLIERIKTKLRKLTDDDAGKLTELLRQWSMKKTEELISKREICLYLFFKLKERHNKFDDKKMGTIQVSKFITTVLLLMSTRENLMTPIVT